MRTSQFGRFLQVAFGSACEVEYQLLLSRDLSLITNDQYQSIVERLLEVKRMLHGLLKRVQRPVAAEQVAAL